MILTITPNPTVDRATYVRGFRWGEPIRAEAEVVTPSGKAVDASLAIRELGGETLAILLNAGATGQLLENLLRDHGLRYRIVTAIGETRMATVLIDLAAGKQTTIVAPTMSARAGHARQLIAALRDSAPGAWGVICGGSLPPGLPSDTFARLLALARREGLISLLDSAGEALLKGVAERPNILKVNVHEFSELRCALNGDPNVRLTNGRLPGGLRHLCRSLADHLGVWAKDAIIVTLGARGAVAATTEGCYLANGIRVTKANSAGAGDALGGALMLAREKGASWAEALELGTAAAAATVMSPGTGISKRGQVERLLREVQVTRL